MGITLNITYKILQKKYIPLTKGNDSLHGEVKTRIQ